MAEKNEKENSGSIMNGEFLYLIRAEDKIKIGITKDPEKRLAQLQTSNPNKLKVEALLYLDGEMREIESWLHKKFKEHNLSGEWFNVGNFELFNILKDLFADTLKKRRNYESNL